MSDRILVVGSFAESLINFRGDLIGDLVARGNTVFGCAPDGTEEFRARLSEIGAEYVSVPLQRTGLNFLQDIKYFFALRKIIKDNGINVVLSYTIKPVVYASLAARSTSIKTICSIVTGVGYAFTNKSLKGRLVSIPARILLKAAFRYNSLVFFQNPDDKKLFEDIGIINDLTITRIVNGSGVNTNHFKSLPFPADVAFLMMARLVEQKGVRQYVEACEIIKRKYGSVRCLLAGFIDSNPNAIDKAELQKWQDEGHIEFLGEIEDVNSVFALTSVYVLPSYYGEGVPRTVLEAMSTGRPVITTDAPGCRETVVEGENGFLVPVKQSSVLATKMEYFIENQKKILEMGSESRKIAEEKYDVHKVNTVMIKAINDVSSVAI